MSARPVLGVLGGMGPRATLAFLERLVALTPADSEKEHLRVLTWSDPTIPDRVGPLLHGQGEDPGPALVAGARRLERAGAEFLAMPCNTAHAWHESVSAALGLPFLHIVDAVRGQLDRRLPSPDRTAPRRVGVLATRATMHAELYEERLGPAWHVCRPTIESLEADLLPAIADVKLERLGRAREGARRAVRSLEEQGVDALVLGCTELPAVLDPGEDARVPCIDSADALARACLEHAGFAGERIRNQRP